MAGSWVLAVDPFAVVVLGGLAGLLVALLLLAVLGPRSGTERAGSAPGGRDDLEGLLGAANAGRRRRGEPELTERGLRAQLVAEQRAGLDPGRLAARGDGA